MKNGAKNIKNLTLDKLTKKIKSELFRKYVKLDWQVLLSCNKIPFKVPTLNSFQFNEYGTFEFQPKI